MNANLKTFISWFAGFFEDQGLVASSKRIGAYFGLFLMYKEVAAHLSGTTISDVIWYGTIGFTFGMWGLTVPEWFSPKGSMIGGAKIETSTATTTIDKSIDKSTEIKSS